MGTEEVPEVRVETAWKNALTIRRPIGMDLMTGVCSCRWFAISQTTVRAERLVGEVTSRTRKSIMSATFRICHRLDQKIGAQLCKEVRKRTTNIQKSHQVGCRK